MWRLKAGKERGESEAQKGQCGWGWAVRVGVELGETEIGARSHVPLEPGKTGLGFIPRSRGRYFAQEYSTTWFPFLKSLLWLPSGEWTACAGVGRGNRRAVVVKAPLQLAEWEELSASGEGPRARWGQGRLGVFCSWQSLFLLMDRVFGGKGVRGWRKFDTEGKRRIEDDSYNVV